MSDHPTTFAGDSHEPTAVEWNDQASLHLNDSGEGILSDFKSIRRGTLLELVRQVEALPEDQRSRYVIRKAGDRTFEAAEIMALAGRPDFPG